MRTLTALMVLTAATVLPCLAANSPQFKQKILNGRCCVPNLSHGYHPVQLKNGHYKQAEETVDVDTVLFGTLDGKPVAVAVMSNNTGGSGWFNNLLLYEERQGKAVVIGSFGFGDRAIVRELRFTGGKVKLVAEESIGPDAGKLTTQLLARKDFDKAECLEAPLSAAMKKDVDELIRVWQAAGGDNLKVEDKKTALEICLRHKQDAALLAKALKLTLAEQGWLDPGDPAPLQFDAAGKPRLYIDDKKATIDLASP